VALADVSTAMSRYLKDKVIEIKHKKVEIKVLCRGVNKFKNYYLPRGSRDSTVGLATSYGLDDRGIGVRVPVGSTIFSSPRRPD
jgi:hypothetical protein